MNSLVATGGQAFLDHVEALGAVGPLFDSAMAFGLERARNRLCHLERAVEATREMLDDARRDLKAALEDVEDDDFYAIDRLRDEVGRLSEQLEHRIDLLKTGHMAVREVEERLGQLREELIKAIFRAQSAMLENHARFVEYEKLTPMPSLTGEAGIGRSAAAGAEVRRAPTRSSAFGAARRLPPLPRGMQWVPLDSLIWHDPPETLVFEKASRSDIGLMMQTFADAIMPMLAVDRNLDADFLAQQDAVRRKQPGDPDSLLGTWERLVSGSDPIVLSRDGGESGRFTFNSGRHRALVARDLGWTHVPAYVSGSKEGSTQ